MKSIDPTRERPYLRTSEVADMFGVTPSSVFTWVKNGKLRPIRTPGGNFRFARADVERLQEQKEPSELQEPAVPERRQEPRFKVKYPATMTVQVGTETMNYNATIKDISASGIGLILHSATDMSPLLSSMYHEGVTVRNMPRSPLRETVPVEIRFIKKINATDAIVGLQIR